MSCLLAPTSLHPTHRLPALSLPEPPTRAHADYRGQSPGLAQAGRRRALTPSGSVPSSCRFPSVPTTWQSAAPTPTPVWSSRHSLSFHRNSDFPGVWKARQGGRSGGVCGPQPNCCWSPSPATAAGRDGHCHSGGMASSGRRGQGTLELVPIPSRPEIQNNNNHT